MSKETMTPLETISSSPDSLDKIRLETCPHCGNSTRIDPSKVLFFRCGICGKARVPIDLPDFKRTNEEAPLLARASASHTAALAWTAGSAVLGAFSLISLAALALVASALNPGLLPMFFGLLISLLPAGLAAHGLRRASLLRKQVAPILEDGWLQATREIIETKGTITDIQLAKILRVDRARAEQLLTQLSATSTVRHRIEDPSPLSFEAAKVRIQEPKAKSTQEDQDDSDALEVLETKEKAPAQKSAKELDS